MNKKFKLTPSEKQWLKSNYRNYTTRQLYEYIMANRTEQTGYTTFRTALYRLNLKKCAILRWTARETAYLLTNYATCGNIEIAQKLRTKKRPFTKKNVEKKMKLMKLKRTPPMLECIRNKHKANGVYRDGNLKMWSSRKAQDGDRRQWVINGIPRVVIKINGKFIHYARYRYIELHGSVPAGHKVYHKDGNTLNVSDDNLIALPAGCMKRSIYKAPKAKNLKEIHHSRILQEEAPEPMTPTPMHQPKGIALRIDRNTVVYVPAGTNVEEFKRKISENSRKIMLTG